MSDSDLEKSPVSVKRAREDSFTSEEPEEQVQLPPQQAAVSAESVEEAVDPKDQPQMITNLQDEHFRQGAIVHLISSKWLTRWKEYCARMSSAQAEARKIGEQTNPGPINNHVILNSQGGLAEDLVYDENVYAVPFQAWQKLVKWYGVMAESEYPIERQVIKNKEGQLTVELYPPTFRLYYITESDITQKNDQLTRCPIITLSETNFVQDFIQSVKNAFDLSPDTDIQAWILASVPTTEGPFVSINMLNGASLFDLDQSDTTTLSQYAGQQYNIAIEIKDKIWGKFPSENNNKSSASSVSSASSALFANGFNNLTTSSTTTPPPSTTSITTFVSAPPAPPARLFTRGVCGLQNLGNTCFMNSALQCLSNTPQLTKYFLADLYKRDLNPDNPLGMKGQVAEAYGELIARLWSASSGSIAPRDFKYTIGRFNSSFSGYQQHDTQELLAFLLDGLHEDLNRIIKKPYIELPDFDGMKDQEIATKSWDYHKARNDSVIVDLFQGQFKSRLICEECKNVSVTFDPFMYLSLPLPIKKKSKTTIIYVPYNPSQRLQKVVVTTSKEASIAHLQKEVAKMMNAQDPNALLVVEIFSHKIYKVFAQYEPVATIGTSDVIYVYELPGPVPPLPVAPPKKKKPFKYSRFSHLSESEEEEDEDDRKEPVDPDQLIVFPVYCATVEKTNSQYTPERIEQFGEPIILAVPYKDANKPDLLYSLVSQHVERYTQFKLFEEVQDSAYQQPPLVAAAQVEEMEEGELVARPPPNGHLNPFLNEDEENDDEYNRIDSEIEEAEEEEEKPPTYLQPSPQQHPEPFTFINHQAEEVQEDQAMDIDQLTPPPPPPPPLPPQQQQQAAVHTAAAVTAAGGKKTEPMSNLFAMKVFSGHSRSSYSHCPGELLPTVQSWNGLVDLYERAHNEQKQLEAYLRQQNGEESSSASESEVEKEKEAEGEDTEMEDSIVLPSKMVDDEGDDQVEDAVALFGDQDTTPLDAIPLEEEETTKEKELGELIETAEDDTEADSNANASYQSDADSDRGFLTNSSIIQPGPIIPPPIAAAAVVPSIVKPPVVKRKILRPPPATIIRQGEGILLAWTPKKAQQLFGTARHSGSVCTDAWDDIQDLGDPAALSEGSDGTTQKKKQVTLSDCLDEFTKEEELSEEDLWYCPKCKKHQRATKKFDLWRMPEIMVVHLKRFSHSRTWRDKIDALIDFPTTEPLDLTDRVLSIQDPENIKQEDRLIYDLYGVDNHYGGLGGGHYTSFAQNFEDEQWYNFDDSHVTKVDVSDIKTTAAYLLFYKRRRPINNESTQSVEEIIQEAHAKQQAAMKQEEQEEEMSVILPAQQPIITTTTTTTTSSSSISTTSDIEEEDDEIGPPPPSYDAVAQTNISVVSWAQLEQEQEPKDEPISEWPRKCSTDNVDEEEVEL